MTKKEDEVQVPARRDHTVQTIMKEEGQGPYLWVIAYKTKESREALYSIFSIHEDASNFHDTVLKNGHRVLGYSLGVDNCRRTLTRPTSTEEPYFECKECGAEMEVGTQTESGLCNECEQERHVDDAVLTECCAPDVRDG